MPLGRPSTRSICRHWRVWRSSLDDFNQWWRPTPSTQRGNRGKTRKCGLVVETLTIAATLPSKFTRRETTGRRSSWYRQDRRCVISEVRPMWGRLEEEMTEPRPMRRARLTQRGPARRVRRGAASVLWHLMPAMAHSHRGRLQLLAAAWP